MLKRLLAVVALLGASTAANASIIPSLSEVTDNGSDFTFEYQGTLSGDSGVKEGSKLVIFDFAGYVDGSIFAPTTDIATSIELFSNGLITPFGFVDNPTVENLVFTWIGDPFQVASGPFAPLNFDGLGARSTLGGLAASAFSAITVKNNPDGVPGGSGTRVDTLGSVTVPGVVPEPATWAMLIGGFGLVGAAMRRRRAGRPRVAYA